MDGHLKREYNFSIIATANDLKSLSDILTKDFKEVRYEIETEDGATYKTDCLEEILKYTNPDGRKIIKFTIYGNKDKFKNFFSPNFFIFLFDTSIYDKSCIFKLNEVEEKDIIFYANKVDEYMNSLRAPYWWIYKDHFYWIAGFFLYSVFSIIYLTNVNSFDPINKVYYLLQLQGISAICMAFSMFFLHKIVSYFYPESCFAIGEQEKHKAKKEKIRNLIWGTIFGALILGVISNIIAHYITN